LGKISKTLSQKQSIKKKTGCVSAVEHLLSVCEAPCPIPTTVKKKGREAEGSVGGVGEREREENCQW
jgi:hypothetical protein